MKFFLNTNFIIEQGSSHKISDLINDNIENISCPALIYDQVLDGQEYFIQALKNLKIKFPDMEYCTDNAAMIAMAGYLKFKNNQFSNSRSLLIASFESIVHMQSP